MFKKIAYRLFVKCVNTFVLSNAVGIDKKLVIIQLSDYFTIVEVKIHIKTFIFLFEMKYVIIFNEWSLVFTQSNLVG